MAGNTIDADTNLFIIADLSSLLATANVPATLTARLEALPADERNWSIFRRSDGAAGTGNIDAIGQIVGPAGQTIALTGSLDNRSDAFRPDSL